MALSPSLWYLSEEGVESLKRRADLETPERVQQDGQHQWRRLACGGWMVGGLGEICAGNLVGVLS